MKTFKMVRNYNAALGLHGQHIVDGVKFKNGQVVVCWLRGDGIISIYPSLKSFKDVHADGVDDELKVIWEGS